MWVFGLGKFLKCKANTQRNKPNFTKLTASACSALHCYHGNGTPTSGFRLVTSISNWLKFTFAAKNILKHVENVTLPFGKACRGFILSLRAAFCDVFVLWRWTNRAAGERDRCKSASTPNRTHTRTQQCLCSGCSQSEARVVNILVSDWLRHHEKENRKQQLNSKVKTLHSTLYLSCLHFNLFLAQFI